MMDNTNKLGNRILYNPFTRIVIGIGVCVAVFIAVQAAINWLLGFIHIGDEIKTLVTSVIATLAVLTTYIKLYSKYEHRAITELSTKHLAKNIILGIALGALLQCLTIFVIYLNHGFSVIAVNSFLYVLPGLGISLSAAILEEILFRGIIFRITEEKLGSYIALAISGLIFGLAHLANPNSTLVAALGIAVQAGLLLGAAYIYTRGLWLPIVLHFAWDFTQSGIFGATMSGGTTSKSLLTTRISGPTLISGGDFGPEGSIQATLFCLAAAIVLLVLNNKQHKLIKPYWAT